jgi:hypothetical protein
MQNSPRTPAPEPESLDQLRGDCARMAPHWPAAKAAPAAPQPAAGPSRGVQVPAASARLVAGMADYGD